LWVHSGCFFITGEDARRRGEDEKAPLGSNPCQYKPLCAAVKKSGMAEYISGLGNCQRRRLFMLAVPQNYHQTEMQAEWRAIIFTNRMMEDIIL
jgi:hypothetical protein